jgi:hypothetical protein
VTSTANTYVPWQNFSQKDEKRGERGVSPSGPARCHDCAERAGSEGSGTDAGLRKMQKSEV